MNRERYVIGVDYGTLSGRAILVRLSDGTTLASAVKEYTHGVMDTAFTPDDQTNEPLPPDWALQHPMDYIEVLTETIPAILRDAGVAVADIVGLGIDFTASSPLPVLADGTPLCFLPKYAHRPHAYVKLWKHHGAMAYADRMIEVAERRQESWLDTYGRKISSEWLVPKLYQIAAEDGEIYENTACFVEAGDWVIWQLTGFACTSTCMAGYKCNLSEEGFLTKEYLCAVDPILANADEKWLHTVLPLGACAGGMTADWATKLGLPVGLPVAVAGIDGHAAVPAAGICKPGQMLLILGTSSCHMLVEDRFVRLSGICGRAMDGMIPGYWGYESGQCCVGDHYQWLTDNLIPSSYEKEAADRGIHIQKLLTEKAEQLKPGQSGLVALDWWNGNRSILMDSELSGLLVGMTLGTRVEEIYRTLIEATAYGTRRIVENFRAHGLRVDEILVTGGIAGKNPMLMQIYADVLNMDLRIAGGTSALGAAIYGAMAAGDKGYTTMAEAASHMGSVTDTVYSPLATNVAMYDKLYGEYRLLHDAFGGASSIDLGGIMKRLRLYKKESMEREYRLS